jgi:hypothetical protein
MGHYGVDGHDAVRSGDTDRYGSTITIQAAVQEALWRWLAEERSMNDHAMDMVMQRLARLERAQRWWKLVGSAAVAALGFVILLGAAKRQEVNIADEIWARKFVIADQNGKPRGLLTEDAQGVALQLTNESGRTRLLLSVSEKNGPLINLLNANGTLAVTLAQHAFSLGQNRFTVQIGEDGRPTLMLSDRSGKAGLNLGMVRDESPAIWLIDAAGRTIWRAP